MGGKVKTQKKPLGYKFAEFGEFAIFVMSKKTVVESAGNEIRSKTLPFRMMLPSQSFFSVRKRVSVDRRFIFVISL